MTPFHFLRNRYLPCRWGVFPALVLAGLSFSFASMSAAEDPFASGVRPTDPRTPAEQQKTFKLPPGFEIQLVGHEPDINKPMNLAFDAKGRLWVTTSIEYPWAAPTNRPAKDRLMIFEDFGPDGLARKVTQFAEGLNIPIGVYPLTGARRSVVHGESAQGGFGNAAIVWSIPNIWVIEDTDGDGKADKRDVLYGPFDYTRDTHGNQASFRRGFDGWLYATHGFNNDSHVKGRDGHEVHLNSGNTYRMRLDGSRIEHYTHGQVNPYGLAFDELGNLFSSDCHSEPVYQLLAGGYYPSFGKPHDGLGFAPNMMEKMRGSTAIDGVSIATDDLWPEEFRGNIFFGDVMASRILRDRVTVEGSTRISRAMPDFVATDDPWFRPVDTCLGPDGALYIADFYNRIIGHYEVPLTHPGRDRERGRLWRMIYRGADGQAKLHARKIDLTTATADQLVDALADPNLPWRMLAMNQIEDRLGKAASGLLQRALNDPENAFQQAHALWLLHRLNPPTSESGPTPNALTGAAKSRDPLMRVHAQRLAADMLYQDGRPGVTKHTDYVSAGHAVASDGLSDSNALVQRCAAEALGHFRSAGVVRPLLDLLARVPAADTHLRYVVRKSIRDQLNNDAVFQEVDRSNWSAADLLALADVAVAVKSERAGSFLNKHLASLDLDRPTLTTVLQHIARYAPVMELDSLGTFVKSKFAEDLDFQLALFNSISTGADQRGAKLSESLRGWGGELCTHALAMEMDSSWTNLPLDNTPTANPWGFEERRLAGGGKARLLSSLPRGEALTGTLRSREFELPAKFSFYLAGHDGFPDKPAQKKNVVRLRLAERGVQSAAAPLAEAFAPRNDVAQKISWDLTAHAGRRVYLEVTDADTGGAYAWLAFGQFEPPVLALPTATPADLARRQTTAAEIAAKLGSASFAQPLEKLSHEATADADARAAAAKALLALAPSSAIRTLTDLLADVSQAAALRARLGELLGETKSSEAHAAVVAAMKSVPYRIQQRWAVTLTGSREGADAFLTAAEQGLASPRILQSVGARNRLQAVNPPDWQARLAKITANLPPADEARDKLIAERRAAFASAKPQLDAGRRVFQQACVVCHKLGSEGALVGPQLDGIGNRGLERVLEDMLDPNRNVDVAFRTTTLTLKDGELMTGLFRREEGELVVLANAAGQEVSVAKSQIASRRETEISIMPENFGEALSAEDFNHLLAFLLAQRGQN